MLYHLLAVAIGFSVGIWYLQDDMLHTMKGKRVLVTGASDGIGEQIAYHSARLGASVVVTSRRMAVLNEVVNKCHELSPSKNVSHLAIAADMSNMSATENVVKTAVDHLGGLDILILNHIANGKIEPFTGSLESLQKTSHLFDVNFRSYVYLAGHALPHLVAAKGSITVVNSLLGRTPHPFLAGYSASKHGLNGFFNSLRNQLQVQGGLVDVTSCTLGLISTQNAMRELKDSGNDNVLTMFKPCTPSDTALAILSGSLQRKREVFYPYASSLLVTYLYGIVPEVSDIFLQTMFG